MLKHFKKGELVPTELTWEEKNPINYLYRPSEAISRLQERLAKSKGQEASKLDKSQQK
jgi:hypothetical protein